MDKRPSCFNFPPCLQMKETFYCLELVKSLEVKIDDQEDLEVGDIDPCSNEDDIEDGKGNNVESNKPISKTTGKTYKNFKGILPDHPSGPKCSNDDDIEGEMGKSLESNKPYSKTTGKTNRHIEKNLATFRQNWFL